MIRRWVYILFAMCFALPVVAQDMKVLFVAMPDSIAPLLTKINREDCVDFLASNMKAMVKNRFGNTAELKDLTEDYLLMQTTEKSSMEMKLLPMNDSVKVICMVKTVCASACDSEIHFYDTDWKKLDATVFFQKPAVDAFYVPQDSVSEEAMMIRKIATMDLMKASLSKEGTSLTFIYTTPESLNKEDSEKLSPYLRKEPVVYQWNSGKFIR